MAHKDGIGNVGAICPDEIQRMTALREERLGKFRLISSPDGRDGSVIIHQNVDLYNVILEH